MVDNSKKITRLTIIWLALCISQLLYVGIGFSVGPELETEVDDIILYVLLGSGLMSTVVALVVIPQIIKVKSMEQYFTYTIVRMALLESIAIEGFVGYYIGGPQMMQWAMTMWALALMLLVRPTEAEFNKLCGSSNAIHPD